MGGKEWINIRENKNGITLISLVISIIVMLILAGVSINAVVSENGVLTQARNATFLQSVGVLQEYLQMEYAEYNQEASNYDTQLELIKDKHPEWFYQNAQGYILDSDGHVLYLIKKSGLPEEIRDQIRGGDATRVSQYYRQQDVYGVTSDLQVYYCSDGTDTILGLTVEDLQKDNPLEIAYDEDSLLAQVVNGVGEDGRATEVLSVQDLKSIKILTIDSIEKLALLTEFKELPTLQTVYFSGITIPNLEGIQYAKSITEVRFTNCAVSDYSALCGLTNLNKLYLIAPTGKNIDVATLCSSDKGIATAEFGNLRYFGIVGSASYLQSTSINYSEARYNITDISGLANFSTTTKQAIQYMYLQNLQLTSIASLADFINVSIMRLEANALITFDGIQNMSKLSYLIAPICYSTTGSSYTLGINETDIQNTNTDVLSYIYKDENGNNTSLYYLDIRSAKNLKWTSYLSTCTGLKYLYMTDNISIKDISTITNVIANCGVNYKMPSTYTLDIISNTSAWIDLSNMSITTQKFELLKNNSKLTHLDLSNTKITDDSGIVLSGENLNTEINTVLSTCVNLERVRLNNITDLSTIEFVKNTPKLFEIQLMNTSVTTGSVDSSNNYTGLELLNTNCSNLHILCANTETINLGNIENCLQKLFDGSSGASFWGGTTARYTFYTNSAVVYKTLENAKNLTNINLWCTMNFSGVTVDISDFENLTRFSWHYGSQSSFILPSSVETLIVDQFHSDIDISQCISLKTINVQCASTIYVQNMMDTMPDNLHLTNLTLRMCNYYTESNFERLFQECNNLTIDTFNVGIYHTDSHYINKTLTSLDGIEKINGLKNLYMSSFKALTDISALENCNDLELISFEGNTAIKDYSVLGNRESLKNLVLIDSNVKKIDWISGNTNLISLNFSNNGINDIKPLENLKKLETLNLQNNALYDNSYDSAGRAYYILTVFSDLNQNQDGSLKNLYLSGNKIDDFSMLQDSNLKWELKSGW